ncbi:MAG: hypothetical protein ACQEQ0_09640 [Bacteroidota bacterium]
MKKRKMLFMLPLAALLMFPSCNDEETAFEAEVDVFVLSQKDSVGATVYAPVYYVYGNKDMDDATVLKPDQSEVQLETDGNMKTRYLKEPSDEDFQSTAPMAGTYTFDILASNGEEFQESDQLGSAKLPPTTIEKAVAEENVLEMEWMDIGAQAYSLRMYAITSDNEDQIIYSGDFQEADTLRMNAAMETFHNGQRPQMGEDYILEVQSYQFEENVQSNYSYNIQAVSAIRDTITWN